MILHGMGPIRHRNVRAGLERALIGFGMSMMAWLLERLLLRTAGSKQG